MGLKPYEFFDMVELIVKKEKRNTPFKDGRPGYDWYRSFLQRNASIISPWSEVPLEACRAKLDKTTVDRHRQTDGEN